MNEAKIFSSRKELYEAGLHNSYQKGIGKSKNGSGNMSIVLSGGYADDADFGDTIIYTGEGGRDASTGAQVTDQLLSGGNKNLIEAFEYGTAVYVIRGSTHKSDYSPAEGYAYAGKFYISDHWIEKGRDGFDIIRFKLVSGGSPVEIIEDNKVVETQRIEYISTRIVRDTRVAKRVKDIYDSTCQVCGVQINLPTGNKYAEGAHIRPLGMPHNGPDLIENILCLCPNHHLMFDKYCYSINPATLELIGLDGTLHLNEEHQIDRNHLQYHYNNYMAHV
jgi:putative restriction endonuclease